LADDSGRQAGDDQLTDLEITNDSAEAAFLASATFLQISIGATVPLRDYAASVAIVAEALGLRGLQSAALSSAGILD
jgi:hypothetical protein